MSPKNRNSLPPSHEKCADLVCKIMIRMVYAKEVLNMLSDWFIRVRRDISHKNLQVELKVTKLYRIRQLMSNIDSFIKFSCNIHSLTNSTEHVLALHNRQSPWPFAKLFCWSKYITSIWRSANIRYNAYTKSTRFPLTLIYKMPTTRNIKVAKTYNLICWGTIKTKILKIGTYSILVWTTTFTS